MIRLEHCVCCGAAMPAPLLDLGEQPLANSYHDGSRPLPRYPLAVAHCRRCAHNQLTAAIPPEAMFRHYLYVSGTTQTLRSYFDSLAERVATEVGTGASVLDIGCNDGTFLEALAARGLVGWGVDPAENLTQDACARGLRVTTGFWSAEFAKGWEPRHDAIIAMNVVGHVADPLDFLRGCKHVLAPGGRVYVQTSQCDWLDNGEFDCVYHEHISYFTERSFRALADRAGLVVERVEKVPIHGRSWLFTLRDGGAEWPRDEGNRSLPADTTGEDDKVERLAANADAIRSWTRGQVEAARARGHAVAGYGAAAKGNTFLNFAQLRLDYIVDDNPLKWGLLTPGQNIPICEPAVLAQETRALSLLLLAWNFEKEIVLKVGELRQEKPTAFLRYFPDQAVFSP